MTNEHSDRAPSSIRDDSICEPSLPPNKSSGDIVERLRERQTHFYDGGKSAISYDPEPIKLDAAAEIERLRRELEAANNNHRSMAHLLAETGIRLEATKREVENLQRALVFWMPGVDLRLDEATRERAAQDAGLLAGYTEPLDGPCWGDGMLDRALSAESAVAAAYENAAKICRRSIESHQGAMPFESVDGAKTRLARIEEANWLVGQFTSRSYRRPE